MIHPQVLKTDAQKAFTMLKKMTAKPTEVSSPKAAPKNAMIPLDFLKRCKVTFKNQLKIVWRVLDQQHIVEEGLTHGHESSNPAH